MKFSLDAYIGDFTKAFPRQAGLLPWQITHQMAQIVEEEISRLNSSFEISNGVAIHFSATVEAGAVLKAPAIIGEACFIGAHAYLRGGVYLGKGCSIGPGCEIKSSLILDGSAMAHFNFIGDSIIGHNVNFEAGSLIANHYNERKDKQIKVRTDSGILATGATKFGALIGDGARIGANAVLSPGTLLPPGAIVGRLELVEQLKKE